MAHSPCASVQPPALNRSYRTPDDACNSPTRPHPRRALRDLFQALDTRGIRGTARSVATVLWTFSNASGGSWPSQRRIARMTGRCERTVRSAVRELETAGVIVRQVPTLRLRRARHATTVYRLLAGDAPPLVAPVAAPVEPPAELVAVVGRVAELIARGADAEPRQVPTVANQARDLAADAEPPLVEFLPPVDLAADTLDVAPEPPPAAVDLAELADDTDTAPAALVAAELAAELADAPTVDAEPPPVAAESVPTRAVGWAPVAPLDTPAGMPPFTGNPCRIRETPNLRAQTPRARVETDAPPPAAPRRPPLPCRRWVPRYGPVRAMPSTAATSTPATPRKGTGEASTPSTVASTPSTPPALAAVVARCAALARRR